MSKKEQNEEQQQSFIQKVKADLGKLKTDEEQLQYVEAKLTSNESHIQTEKREEIDLQNSLNAAREEQQREISQLRQQFYDSSSTDMLNKLETMSFSSKKEQLSKILQV